MAATSRPVLTLNSLSDVADVDTVITTTTLTNINTVTSARAPSQHLDLPQRSIFFQTQLEGIGANFQWEVNEFFLSVKQRGLR